MSLEHPVAIVGAGPAGVSAAAWLDRYDVDTRWFDASPDIGGLLRRINNAVIDFPPGTYRDGAELADALARFTREEIGHSPDVRRVANVEKQDSDWELQFAGDDTLTSSAVILATGTRYRRLGVPGEAEGLGSYVSQSATRDAHRFAGDRVAVVGGGDAAFENAVLLAEADCDVVLLARNPNFAARRSFVRRAEANPDIEIAPIPSVVRSMEGIDEGCVVTIETEGEIRREEFAAVFVRVGVEPVLPPISPEPTRSDGFVVVDEHQATDHPGLFAAGDVTTDPLRSVVTATAAGARAARCCAEYLGLF